MLSGEFERECVFANCIIRWRISVIARFIPDLVQLPFVADFPFLPIPSGGFEIGADQLAEFVKGLALSPHVETDAPSLARARVIGAAVTTWLLRPGSRPWHEFDEPLKHIVVY